MRIRLTGLILTLMATALVCLGVPLGQAMSNSYSSKTFLDRLNDTARFAALAQQADTTDQLDTVRSELDRYQSLYGIACFVLADDGSTVRLAAPRGATPPRDKEALERISNALGGRRSETPNTRWPWSRESMVVAEPIVRGGDVVGAMVTSSPMTKMHARVLRAWLVLVALGTIALIACGYLADRLARWVLQPVRTLDAAATEVGTGRIEARVAAETGPPELRRLVASFNEMADHMQLSLEQQQAFVADASHQLRNPLAALLLRIDDLSGRVPVGLRGDANQALDEGRRLVDILERLLELARAENAEVHEVALDLGSVVQQRLTTWRPIAEARHIRLEYAGPDVILAWADESATSNALDVVIDNAVKFSPDGGTVAVCVSEGTGHTVAVAVLDSGPGLTREELARVGSRFWRGTGQNAAGYGLGLSIAGALLRRVGGRLEFSSPSTGGLEVRLVLNRATVSSSASGTSVPHRGAAAPDR